jgi:hypothetical protein
MSNKSQDSQPGDEFGHFAPVIVGNRRYMLLSDPSQPNAPSKPTKKPTIPQSTPPIAPTTNLEKSGLELDQEWSHIDPSTGKDRTSIHSIPIIKNPQTGNYTLLFTFPALLAPALTNTYSVSLPEPTEGGSVSVLLSMPTLEGLIKKYQLYFTAIYQARHLHPATHYFGIPLGPVNPLCYDLSNTTQKRAISKIEHFDDVDKKADYMFHTKFMQSETAQLLSLNVMGMFKKMGLNTNGLMDMVLMKHNNYAQRGGNKSTEDTTETVFGDEPLTGTALEADLHLSAIMPIPKLHCTLFILRILSRDEFDIVSNVLQRIQQVVYDAIGGTSLSLRIMKCTPWHVSTVDGVSRAKHFVGELTEVFKEGKINPSDHIPVSIADPHNTQNDGNSDSNQSKVEIVSNVLPNPSTQQQTCPRLALIAGIIAHALLRVGILSSDEIKRNKIGTETGQFSGLNFHMTLLNAKYASRNKNNQNGKFLLDAAVCQKAANASQLTKGVHRVPCINLYRMGSNIDYGANEKMFDKKWANFDQLLYPRHRIKDHYCIDYTLPMP